MRRGVLLIAAASIALAGCANLNTVFHRFTPDSGESAAVDAKERIIFSLKKTYKGAAPDGGDLEWRAVCAEPSPDALAAISASAGVSAEVLQKALSGALSSNESAASIGLRTQTIQLLRDSMYRLCEGYASGALDEIGFTRLQRRYQNVMLGLLAIEQLTGAVTSRQVVLGSKSEASTGQALNQLVSALEDAQKKVASATQTKDDAEKDSTAKEAALKAATDERTKLLAANSNNEKAQAVVDFDAKTFTPAKTAAAKAKQSVADATTIVEQAQVGVDSIKKGLETARKNTAAGSASGQFDTTTMLQSNLTGSQATAIADKVHDIVKLVVERDYTSETCFDTMASRQTSRMPEDMRLMAVSYCLIAMRQQSIRALAANPKDPDVRALAQGHDAFSKDLETLILAQLGSVFEKRLQEAKAERERRAQQGQAAGQTATEQKPATGAQTRP